MLFQVAGWFCKQGVCGSSQMRLIFTSRAIHGSLRASTLFTYRRLYFPVAPLYAPNFKRRMMSAERYNEICGVHGTGNQGDLLS